MKVFRLLVIFAGFATSAACDGSGTTGPIPTGSGHLQVSVGGNHACVLEQDGAVFCWGSDAWGQLGDGGEIDFFEETEIPRRVAGELRFREISAGSGHTCGLIESGEAYCWGGNGWGESGSPPAEGLSVPTAVAGGLRFSSISAGVGHTCALAIDGGAWCWGVNYLGALGSGSSQPQSDIPVMVQTPLQFDSISAGRQTCAIDGARKVHCWGSDIYGGLGNPDISEQCPGGGAFGNACSPRPAPVRTEIEFASVSAGEEFSCAVSLEGPAYCWGYGDFGQLGTGSSLNAPVPARVANVSLTHISAGDYSACGLTSEGAVYCWGMGDYGTLGIGSVPINDEGFARPVSYLLPTRIAGSDEYRSVEVGGLGACGITTLGELACWGTIGPSHSLAPKRVALPVQDDR